MLYGRLNDSTLRLFTSQTLCSECGSPMLASKGADSTFYCREHTHITRDKDTVTAERIFFETLKELMLHKQIKGIMIHRVNYQTLERGEFIRTIDTDVLSNPSLSLPFAMAIEVVLRKAAIPSHKLITIHSHEDGIFNCFWRIENVSAQGEMLSSFTKAAQLLHNGFIVGDYFIETITNDNDEAYANAADIISSQAPVPEEMKSSAKDIISNYKRKSPRL